MEQPTLIQISSALIAIAVGYPAARYYWQKHHLSYDLDISWHQSGKAIRCILNITNPTNTIYELKEITAETSKCINKLSLEIASDIPIKRLDREINIPSHFNNKIAVGIKIKPGDNFSYSFFVKIPEDLREINKLFITLNISTRQRSIKDKRVTIVRSIMHL